uniref:Loquacious n=1 Tax=Mayetiola destructor TaxID=39758 RepID=K7Y7N2_MAYDE|nr:loquacious [Mayetiola destructor]
MPGSEGQPGEEKPSEKRQPKKKHLDENVSIEEALKALTLTPEGACNAMKTPVSVLQELLSRRGITPTYDLVQIEGAIHEPTFRYRVTYGNKDAMGAGKSKKEAKHQAARNLIDKLTGIQIADQILPPATPNGNKENDSKVNGNPIGWLQELCMARRWPPPFYETQSEVGLPHERQFTIACHVSIYCETGRGKSKKEAKRLAAHQMWQRLQDLPLDGQDDANDDINRANNMNRYADLKEKRISTLTNQHSYKVSQFHKTLKANSGQILSKLQNTCLNDPDVNFVQFLQEIATEQQFEVTYVDIEEKSYSGQFQCLVQLSTLPVAVCQGSGKTSKIAQTCAARNALEYLKIMTKS